MASLPVSQSPGSAPSLVSSRCASCTAPLAADQLFCLSCGTRRRDARIPFRDVLATEASPALAAGGGGGAVGGWDAPTAYAGAPRPAGGAAYAPFIAMFACLMLALGLGVWIGRGQNPPAAVAAPVTAAAAPVAAAPVATTPTDTAIAAADADTAAADDASASDDSAADDTAKPDTSGTAAVKDLSKLSPKDYQKQSTKLPKEVGTSGKVLPKDDKPAGGGSETQEFQ
jgi:hypothetical protein